MFTRQTTITGDSIPIENIRMEKEKIERLLKKREAETTMLQPIFGGCIQTNQMKMFDTGEIQKSFFEQEPVFE